MKQKSENKSGKTFYSNRYNCAVEIMNIVNDLVEISDSCYIKLK